LQSECVLWRPFGPAVPGGGLDRNWAGQPETRDKPGRPGSRRLSPWISKVVQRGHAVGIVTRPAYRSAQLVANLANDEVLLGSAHAKAQPDSDYVFLDRLLQCRPVVPAALVPGSDPPAICWTVSFMDGMTAVDVAPTTMVNAVRTIGTRARR